MLRAAFVLNLPLARYWLPLIAGRERCMTPKNEKHREYWTSCYPIVALLPVAALVVEANRGDYAAATQPLLALWSEADHVVDPDAGFDAMLDLCVGLYAPLPWATLLALHATVPPATGSAVAVMGYWLSAKLATASCGPSMVTVQVVAVPLHAPFQPRKVMPVGTVAAKVTCAAGEPTP